MLYAVCNLCSLTVIEAVQSSNQIACDAADAFKADALTKLFLFVFYLHIVPPWRCGHPQGASLQMGVLLN